MAELAGDFKIRGVKRRPVRPRTVVTAAIVVALAVVAWSQRDTIAQIAAAVSQGAVVPLIAAAVFELARILFHAMAYTRSFRVIGARVPLTSTVPAWFKAVFMNTVLPSGGTSGLAAVVDAARQRGVAVGSATSATLFTQTCFYLSMLLVIVVGFCVMAQAGTLTVRDVLLGCVMAVVAFAFLGLLAMGHYAPGTLQRFMRAVERLVAKLARRFVKKEPKPWADSLVHSFSAAATELSRHPRRALSVLLSMVVAMAFDMLAFVAAGLAFGITRPDALFGGYVTALVFNSFTVTPGGVGVVEGLAAAVLAGYGYPLTVAVSAVLVYRTLMYWIPFVVGGVMMHVTGAFGLGSQGKAAGAPGSAVVAAGGAQGDEEAVYLHRRRSDATLRERFVSFASDRTELRCVVCAAALAVCALAGFIAAAFPADPVMVEAVTNRVLGHDPLTPTAMTVFSYLLLLCVPGILIRDQGNWLTAIAALLALGVSTALSGRSVWVTLLVIAALALLAVWHGSFVEHGFFGSLRRLMRVLVYAVVVAVLYALIGSLAVRGFMEPDPGFGGALWMGLRSVAVFPRLIGTSLGPEALWFFGSVGAVRVTLTVAMVYVICLVTVRRVIAWRAPEKRAAWAAARAEAEAAALERKEARRRRWAEAADRVRSRRAGSGVSGEPGAVSDGGDGGSATDGGLDGALAGADDMPGRGEVGGADGPSDAEPDDPAVQIGPDKSGKDA